MNATTLDELFERLGEPARMRQLARYDLFDPALRTIFGSGSDAMYRVLSDESDIERLIERLEEIDDEPGCDA